MKFMISSLAILALAACTHAPTEVKRETASTSHTRMKVNPMSCEKAYKKGTQSPSTGEVMDATQTCEKVTEALCIARVQKESDGPNTGDGDYIAATCELAAAYGANQATNKGKATEGCENQYWAAMGSVSRGDVDAATEACKNQQDDACKKMVETTSDGANTGDGRLIGAVCELEAAHGAYLGVKSSASNCHAYRKCLKTCNPNSAHPGMCPATCQEDYDPMKTCNSDPCGQLKRCLKGCEHYKGDHPGMCAPTCQQDYDPKNKCKLK